MIDIGCVLYKKGDEPGTLNAEWFHPSLGAGTGKAIGGSTNGFEGRYHIRYFDKKGKEVAYRELEIQKNGDGYKLTWMNNGIVTSKGIGMSVTEGLVAGWYDLDDEKSRPSET